VLVPDGGNPAGEMSNPASKARWGLNRECKHAIVFLDNHYACRLMN
jgi:hypothetical protein